MVCAEGMMIQSSLFTWALNNKPCEPMQFRSVTNKGCSSQTIQRRLDRFDPHRMLLSIISWINVYIEGVPYVDLASVYIDPTNDTE